MTARRGGESERARGSASGAAAGPRTPEDALAGALRRVRDQGYDLTVGDPERLHWTRRIARLSALVLPFDRHGVGRDLVAAARRGGMDEVRRVVRSLTRPPAFGGTIISRKLRCVWIRISKTASQSTLAAILSSDPDCEVFRMNYAEVYELRPEAREWFTFTFVRHPFERALSFWSEIHFAHERYAEQAAAQERKRAYMFEGSYGLAETQDFDAYCRWLRTPYAANSQADRHVVSQSALLAAAVRARGRPLDFIGRMESLDGDWRRVAARIDAPTTELPLAHSSIGWKALPEAVQAARSARTRLLSERNKALLAARYADDLELGGYSPAGRPPPPPPPARTSGKPLHVRPFAQKTED